MLLTGYMLSTTSAHSILCSFNLVMVDGDLYPFRRSPIASLLHRRINGCFLLVGIYHDAVYILGIEL